MGWTTVNLIKYFVTVQSMLTATEFEKLKTSAIFSKEILPGAKPEQTTRKYRASELYEPLDTFRQLQLPVLDWGIQPRWRTGSEEGASVRKPLNV